jgi:hypothetical protein
LVYFNSVFLARENPIIFILTGKIRSRGLESRLSRNMQVSYSKAEDKNYSVRRKIKNMTDPVIELLGRVNPDRLIKFISEEAARDRNFRERLLNAFSPKEIKDSKELYVWRVKAILRPLEKETAASLTDIDKIILEVYSILETAEEQVVKFNFQSAFNICTAVIEEITKMIRYDVKIDRDLTGCIHLALDILQDMAGKEIDEDIRKELFSFNISAFSQNSFKSREWHTRYLGIALALTAGDDETESIISLVDTASEAGDHELQKIKYKALRKARGEAEACHYLHLHPDNPDFRRRISGTMF